MALLKLHWAVTRENDNLHGFSRFKDKRSLTNKYNIAAFLGPGTRIFYFLSSIIRITFASSLSPFFMVRCKNDLQPPSRPMGGSKIKPWLTSFLSSFRRGKVRKKEKSGKRRTKSDT